MQIKLSKILCKWKQNSAVNFFLYLDSVSKKLVFMTQIIWFADK